MAATTVPDTGPAPVRARARAALAYAAALGLSLAAYANWRQPVLRLASPAANALVFLAALALPWVALVVAGRTLRGWRLAAHWAALTPLLLGTLPLGLCASLDAAETARRGGDVNFEPVRALAVGASRVRVYRTDCGAPCDNGVVVRQERRLALGVLLVRDLGGWSHASDAALAAEPGAVRVTLVPTAPDYKVRVGPYRLPVHPWVYF